nr:immunoglobulin heavy chain junction region [Macaca mulatta]MOW19217.1 immunoglobulin heavy chain junction region [Macaca mulatta]MOW19241.1 immunoglobulin heavy chain junction region [Macaca mulatta]MOW19417.1 immunoglobulin heavy chain junction region [Macaca mulatta]MOW19458.1 immunoglobulin heavy chain junction region [Macaca mulatta]
CARGRYWGDPPIYGLDSW